MSPSERQPYVTKDTTVRRLPIVRVYPAEGSARDEPCKILWRGPDGETHCQEQVEWVEYQPSRGGSHSWACDKHVTPPLDLKGHDERCLCYPCRALTYGITHH